MLCALTLAVALVVAVETTTTEVQRVVGEPLPTWVVVGAGLAVLALIVIAGAVARRHR
ncbi:MAG: hypothetical protein M3N37_05680 [Actinomycetota bacterium]|nr:hypothetical protein [Actinomycetota bacterium]